MDNSSEELNKRILDRIQCIRAQHFGARGRAEFARALGISPSTYNYYERDRVPPPALLVKMCQITGTDLYWLLSGRQANQMEETSAPRPFQPLLQRIQRLLSDQPELRAAISAFLDLLEKRHNQGPMSPVDSVPLAGRAEPVVPILGRTAAGVPQFWKEGELKTQLTTIRPQQWTGSQRCELSSPVSSQSLPHDSIMIQTRTPIDWEDISVGEFLHCPQISACYPDTFALRIDGDSMAPAFQQGDIVLLSPTEPARNGEPAVVQLKNQIGVTCKLYRVQGDGVHLIPVNETLRPTSHPLQEVVWALRVLAKVRIGSL